jgi:hypothetical protein
MLNPANAAETLHPCTSQGHNMLHGVPGKFSNRSSTAMCAVAQTGRASIVAVTRRRQYNFSLITTNLCQLQEPTNHLDTA